MIFDSKHSKTAKLGAAKDNGKKFQNKLPSSFSGIVHLISYLTVTINPLMAKRFFSCRLIFGEYDYENIFQIRTAILVLKLDKGRTLGEGEGGLVE